MPKEKFNLEVRARKGEGLQRRVNPFIKGTSLNQSLRNVSPTDHVFIVESQGM